MFSKNNLNRDNTKIKKESKKVLNIYKVLSEKVLKTLKDSFKRLKNECGKLGKSLLVTMNIVEIGKKTMNKISYVLKTLFGYVVPVVTKYKKKLLLKLSNLKESKNLLPKPIYMVMPVVAITIMFCTINHWNNLDYGLALAYDGKEIGTIQNEKTFEEANQMVNQKLVYNGEADSELSITPTYKLVVSDSQYDSSTDVRDKIIEQSKDTVEEATGLYINDVLIGAVKDESGLSNMLNGILNSRITGENQEATFVQCVEEVDGLYSKESIMTLDELSELVNTPAIQEEFYDVKDGDTPITIAEAFGMSVEELEALNSGNMSDLMFAGMKIKVKAAKSTLSVAIIVSESYEREIDFQTIETKDNDEYTDYSVVTQNGEKGIEHCTDKVSYIDGKEVSRESVSKEIIKEPVNKTVVVGTKERSTSSRYTQGTGKSTGSLAWPVPYTHSITSYFGPRWGRMHTGIDIAANGIYGKDIVAADGGVVVAAGYSGGYGNYVEIDHGNGIRTLYGHASTLYVGNGTRVSKGMPIAAVGSTGFSTGPHCHFEVIVGGSQRNPLNYV